MDSKIIVQSEEELKKIEKGFRIYFGKDEVLRIKAGRFVNVDDLELLNKAAKKMSKTLPDRRIKVLVDISLIKGFRQTAKKQERWKIVSESLTFRRKLSALLRNIFKEREFGKSAVFGGGTAHKVITSFVITATRLKNLKYFRTKKEALEWLKGGE